MAGSKIIKIAKIALISLLSLIIALVLAWCVLKYLVWPKYDMQKLIPGKPLAYISASNLSETVPAIKESRFISQFAKSPLLKDLKSSRLWRQIELQKKIWEAQTEARLNPDAIIQLVGMNSLLALYNEQDRWGFLLLSQVGLLTRMNIMSGSTEEMMGIMHDFTKEKYRGIELMTVKGTGWEFSYGFIGRTGFLSLDKSLLKKVVDTHRDEGQGLAGMPGFEKLFADSPGAPDVSLYINATKIRNTVDLSALIPFIGASESSSRVGNFMSAIQETGTLTGSGLYKDGDLRFDIRMSRAGADLLSSAGDNSTNDADVWVDNLAVPDDCLVFALHKTLELQPFFGMVGTIVDLDTNIIEDKLLPVLDNGAAFSVLKPDVEGSQMLPLVTVFLRMKDKAAVKAVLKELEGSIDTGRGKLKFAEMEYGNIPIRYARIPIIMGMSLDAGYAFIGDDLLVMATDTPALEVAIDVASGKRHSLMRDENYANLLSPIAEASDGRIFMNINSAVPVIKQAAMLYSLRARFSNQPGAAKIATAIHQNAFLMETWRYMGATFGSSADRIDMKLMLTDN